MKNDQMTFSFKEGKISKIRFDIDQAYWQQLEREMSSEENMFRINWSKLKEKWQNCTAAVVVNKSHIISYVSFNEIFGDFERSFITNVPGFEIKDFVIPSILSLNSGWTNKQNRHKNINYLLRIELFKKKKNRNSLMLSLCKGLGAGYVLHKLGFSMVAWEEFPFLSSHICIFYRDSSYIPNVGWLSNMDKEPYNGPGINPYSMLYHDWGKYYYLWIDNIRLAEEVENSLEGASKHDIAFYHSILVSMDGNR